MSIIVFLIVYLGILYYFFIARRKKEKKKRDEFLAALRAGMRVSTISGLRGEIVDISERDVIIELSSDPTRSIKARLLKAGIREEVNG